MLSKLNRTPVLRKEMKKNKEGNIEQCVHSSLVMGIFRSCNKEGADNTSCSDNSFMGIGMLGGVAICN